VNHSSLKTISNKLNLDCIIFNGVGLTYSCEYGHSGISGMLSNGTISFSKYSSSSSNSCNNIFNVVMNRNRARVCEAKSKDSSDGNCTC
jgi:hypothetical protein